jgi:hypothetical protein
MRRTLAVALVWLAALAMSAQTIPATPQFVAGGNISGQTQDLLDRWATLYRNHDWATLQGEIKTQLAAADLKTPNGTKYTVDLAKQWVIVLFASTKFNEKGEIIRVIAHDPAPELFANRFPGINTIYEVAISSNKDTTLQTSYASTRVENPLVTKSADFIKQFDLAKVAAALGVYSAVTTPALTVVVNSVALPDTRATLAVKDTMKLAPTADLGKAQIEGLITQVNKLRQTHVDESAASPCIKAFVTQVHTELNDTLRPGGVVATSVARSALVQDIKDAAVNPTVKAACAGRLPDPQAVHITYQEFLTRIKDGRITSIRARGQDLEGVTSAAIVQATGPSDYRGWREEAEKKGTPIDYYYDDTPLLQQVRQAFQQLVATEPLTITADTAYENTPSERLTYGLVTGAMLAHEESDTRAKVSNGKIVADPLSGTVTMATLTFRPAGTDPKARSFPARERWTLFLGGTLTPEFGLAGGAGFALNRKLSVNIAYALLRINTLREGETLDQAPQSDDPLKNGLGHVLLLGLGYNF